MLRVNTEAVEDSEITRNFDLLTIGTMTIFAGMPQVTAENADEFYVRIAVVEGIIGPFRASGKRFTVAEARAFTGLRTNVTPFTPAKFSSEVRRLMKSQLAELAEARGQGPSGLGAALHLANRERNTNMDMSKRLNDEDRRLFVVNDKYFYREARRYPGGQKKYIRDNRAEIDEAYRATADSTRLPHSEPEGRYLA